MKSIDNNETSSILPEIYIYFKKEQTPSLHLAVAQANIIGLQQLKALGFSKEEIQPCESYNIRSSTEVVQNCICGKVKIKLFCLLDECNGSCSEFGKATVEFLIADDKVHLQKIILGVPFLYQINAKLHFHKHNKCVIKCSIPTKNGTKNVKLQLRKSQEFQLENEEPLKILDQKGTFRVNQLILKKETFMVPACEGIKMPSEITLDKQYSFKNVKDWPRIVTNVHVVLPIQCTQEFSTRNLVLPVQPISGEERQPLLVKDLPTLPSSQSKKTEIKLLYH